MADIKPLSALSDRAAFDPAEVVCFSMMTGEFLIGDMTVPGGEVLGDDPWTFMADDEGEVGEGGAPSRLS